MKGLSNADAIGEVIAHLPWLHRKFIVLYVLASTGGGMTKAIIVLVVALVIALIVFAASQSWYAALVLGFLVGWLANELLRFNRR